MADVFNWLGAKIALTGVVMILVFGFLFDVTNSDDRPSNLNFISVLGIFGFLVVAIIGILVFIWQ